MKISCVFRSFPLSETRLLSIPWPRGKILLIPARKRCNIQKRISVDDIDEIPSHEDRGISILVPTSFSLSPPLSVYLSSALQFRRSRARLYKREKMVGWGALWTEWQGKREVLTRRSTETLHDPRCDGSGRGPLSMSRGLQILSHSERTRQSHRHRYSISAPSLAFRPVCVSRVPASFFSS